MGFFKRILSIGSKRNKKRSATPLDLPPPPSIDDEHRRQLEEEAHEAAVGRLLRSSSSRYAVVKEVDYSALPPLPHPINNVLAQCSQQKELTLHPCPSTASLASSTLSRCSTFSVTVHDRRRHAATEFPNANGDFDDPRTPIRVKQDKDLNKDNGHHLGLRSDPSVVSLIELYDEHGRLPPGVFSNSPPSPERQGRQQKKRNGSTLRELLGAPDSLKSRADNSALESDISWAERFLDGAESVSSHTSSHGPYTPTSCNDSANDRTEVPRTHDITISTTADLSTSIIDDPAITSMEVELSVASDTSSMLDPIIEGTKPYKNMDPATPQRASQVFSFLTRRSTIHEERPLPEPPSAFSSPSDTSHNNVRSHFSFDGSDESPPKNTRVNRDSRVLSKEAVETYVHQNQEQLEVTDPAKNDAPSKLAQQQVRVLMTGPTKVIVTAPTPGTNPTPSRIPIRGPRGLTKRRSSTSRRPPMLTNRMANGSASSRGSKSKDTFTAVPSRKHRRTASHGSSTSPAPSIAEADAMAAVRVLDQLSRSKTYHSPARDKENQLGLTAVMELPSTPLRSNTTSRSSLFRKVVTPSIFQPPVKIAPSPASSTELSPVAKQMMFNARKHRRSKKESEWDREAAKRNGAIVGSSRI